MSDVNVILATNRLQIAHDGDDILLDSVTYINITSVNPLVYEHKSLDGSVPGMPVPYTAATVTTEDTNWAVELHMADGRTEVIKLIDVQNKPGWTNDADGYAQAEADIYAAFPAGGGGGGTGTVTSINVSGGTTGFSFTGGPITTAGTITMTGAPTILAGNTLYVDDVNGNDGTGTRGVFNKPFLTIQAAIAAASANDCIVIRPGSYAGINDTLTDPTVLNFFLMPGVAGVTVTVDTIDANWSFYGAPVGDVSIDAGFAYCFFYGGINGDFACTGTNSADIYGKVGTMHITLASAFLYNGQVAGAVTLESGGSLNVYDSTLFSVTTASNGGVQGAASSITSTVDAGITILGDVFYGPISQPLANSVARASSDGGWKFTTGQGVLQLVDTDNIFIDGSVSVFYMTAGGSGQVYDGGSLAVGTQFTMYVNGSSDMTFLPDGNVDGMGSANVDGVLGLAFATFTHIGGGNWITTG